jgi:hypothetical protein
LREFKSEISERHSPLLREEAVIPELIRGYPVNEPRPPETTAPEVTAGRRERRLFYVLAIILSVNVLTICGIVTFLLLVKCF